MEHSKIPLTTWEEDVKKKILSPDEIEHFCKNLRLLGKTIATLNGSFDLMHAGHLHIIDQASKQADVLIVALNTDRSIQSYKGASRPIIPLKWRLQLMAALQFVSFATWFDEEDPRRLLSLIKPHVHVNGAEWGHNCIERETVETHGGKLHIIERIEGLSTSEVIAKIQSLPKKG